MPARRQVMAGLAAVAVAAALTGSLGAEALAGRAAGPVVIRLKVAD